MAFNFIFQAIMLVFSVSYQRARQRQMQRELDKRKGFELSVDGRPVNLPIPYGRNKVGGVRTIHKVMDNFSMTGKLSNSTTFFSDDPGSYEPSVGGVSPLTSNYTNSGSKREFLITQQAISFEGISNFVDAEIDGLSWDDDRYAHGQWISLNPEGGTADPLGTDNTLSSDNYFSDCSWATCVYKLNRDDYNYSGVPQLVTYVEGVEIHSVAENQGVYSLSPTKVYSNSPPLVLLDYLTRPRLDGGVGFDVSTIDLESFYSATQIANTIVRSDVSVGGRIHGVKPVEEGETPATATRDIPLYECNILLDTQRKFRDNINIILETMGQAELIWSEGKWKLVLEYPTSLSAQNALITASYTDDHIISKGAFTLTTAGIGERFNQCTINFRNEEEDFVDDSTTWPETNSSVHNTYLGEDENIWMTENVYAPGITDVYHAKAKAEQIVRDSRDKRVIDITLTRDALIHDPGDLIKLTSSSLDLDEEVFKIEGVQVNEDFTVRITASSYDYNTLAWSINDDVPYHNIVAQPYSVSNVTSLSFNHGARISGSKGFGWLSWVAPVDVEVRRYEVLYRQITASSFTSLGETSDLTFDIPSSVPSNENVVFLVKVEDSDGRRSPGASTTSLALSSLTAVTNLVATAGINTIALSWSHPNPELVLEYEIYRNITDSLGTATNIRRTSTFNYDAQEVEGTFYYWVRTIGLDGTSVDSTSVSADVESISSSVQDAIDEVQTTIDGVESTLAGVQTTLSGVQTDLDAAESTLSGVQTDVSDLQTDLNTAESTLSGVQTTIVGIQSDIDGVESNIDAVETAINDKLGQSVGLKVNGASLDLISLGDPTAPFSTAARISAEEIILDGSVSADQLAANSVTTDKLAANSVTANELAANSVTADKLVANSITADKLAANSVTTDELATNSVTADKLVANSITADKLAANSVTSDELASNSVIADKLAANSITADKLAANSIITAKLATNSVTTAKLATDSITTDKIAPGSIGYTEVSGTWESSNFSSGSDGLQINWANGDVELNNLVVRGDMIETGAISSKTTATPSAGSVPGTSSTATISGHSATDFVMIGVSFQHRWADTTIQIQVGSEDWQDVHTSGVNSTLISRYHAFIFSGSASSVKVRLNHVGSNSNRTASNFRVTSQIVGE